MSVPAAYLGMILIWSTSPLAVKWSGEGTPVLLALTARMFVGTVLSLALVRLTRTPMPFDRSARSAYAVSGLGSYLSMALFYWAAQQIPSGWLSVIFGLNPIFTGVLAALWLGERNLSPPKLAGMGLGVFGLAVIFARGASLGDAQGLAVFAVLASAAVHAASVVGVKRLGADVPALALSAGGLTVSLFLLESHWLLSGAGWSGPIPTRSMGAILYLGVVGCIAGYTLFFYLLRRVEATRVSLITLITPTLALVLGSLANGEAIDPRVWLGAGLILSGLGCFHFGGRLPLRGLWRA